MDITSVKRIHQSDWTESGIRFLRARDIVADYKKEEVEDKLYISKEKYEEYSLISGKVQIGDLLVTGVGTIGIPYLIRNNEPIYFKDGNIIWFKNNNKIDDNFLYYSFVGSKIQNFINEKSGVGTVGTYTIQSGKETPIMLTSNNEQRKISNLMSNLDNLITLHQRKFNDILVYKLRKKILFLKFTKNVWEQRKLEETSNRFDNLRVPVSANEREKGTTPYYGANGIQDYVKGFTHNGEYVLIAEDGANDLKNYPVKYVNGLFWANNHVHVVQGKEGICDNKYLKYCFTKTNIESLLVGGGRAKLNANIMMGIELTVPSLNEQVELGRMFYELDNLITLHHRKYTYIFYSWEQRKLEDITQIVMGQSPDSINYTDNSDDTVLIQGNADLNNGIVVPRIWSSQITKKSYPNDIIFTVRAPVGEIARNPYFATIGRGVASFKGNDFLYQSLIQKKENNYWNNISAGSTFDSINSDQLKNVIIYLPKNNLEQEKIGELFTNLDNLITLHQHKELKRRNDNNEHLRW